MHQINELPMADAPVKLIQRSMFKTLLDKAKSSARLRTNYNFHPSLGDNPHRFLNVMLNGSYFAPHRHLKPPKAESFLILEGTVAFFIFNDEGRIEETYTLSSCADLQGIDLEPGIWHSLHVVSGYAVCFEVKPGPYDPSEDKEFAPWAPKETDDPQLIRDYQDYLKKFIKVI